MKICKKCDKKYFGQHIHCPKCDSPPEDHKLVNYCPMWHEGENWCMSCKIKVCNFDAG
jgi:hypothetical protein